MSLKSWFAFPVSPENLTPTAELICICCTAVSVIVLLVVAVTHRKNSGKKEVKTAERNSTKALSSGEAEHESKHATPVSDTQTKDINADVQQLQSETQDLKNSSPEVISETLAFIHHPALQLERPESDEQLKETRPEPEIQSSEIGAPKSEKSERLRRETPNAAKKPPSQLKLALALTRMAKLEDQVDTFCSGNNQLMENDLDNLKGKLQAKEKELEKYEWLRNELIHGIRSLPKLKLALATSRIEKLEEKVDGLLHCKTQPVENDLQVLQLEAKEKEANEEIAKVQQQLQDEQQRREDAELIVQKKLESRNELEDRVAELEQQLQDEQQRREDAELIVQKRLESTNKLEDRVAELEQQLKDEQQRREDAEEALKDLKVQVAPEKIKLHQPSADHETTSRIIDELKQTQSQLEERNAEIRKLKKQLDRTLNEEKQRNEKNLQTLKKKFETQNQEFEDKVTEVQQQLKEEQQRREALMELNQEFKRQLSQLKERHKEELERIQLEQQWRKEIEEEVEVLKQELENKRNQLKTAEEEEEPDIAADEPSEPTEPEPECLKYKR